MTWVLVVVLGILFVPVAVQRLRARLWRADRHPSDPAAGPVRFPRVWFQVEPPRRLAANERATGVLEVDPRARTAVLTLAEGDLPITEVASVTIGGRGSDFVGTWIELHARVGTKTTVAYLNDGRGLGWAPIVTGSNLRIADALAALATPTA